MPLAAHPDLHRRPARRVHGAPAVSTAPVLDNEEVFFLQFTERQKSEFKEAFAQRRRKQIWVAALIIPMVLLVVFSEDRGAGTVLGYSSEVFGPIFLAAVAIAVVFSFRNWRCPACNKYLGRAMNPKFCQNCGVELRS